MPSAIPSYQAPATVFPGTSGDASAVPSIPIPSSSTSAQPTTSQRILGLKTRIVVPDETVSLVSF